MANEMEGLTALLMGMGIIAVIGIVLSLIGIVGSIVLLCITVNQKNKIKAEELDEKKINSAKTISIWNLVISILTCSACPFIVFPILGIVFASNARTFLKSENFEESLKKCDMALLMNIIYNSIVLGLIVLNVILGFFEAFIN